MAQTITFDPSKFRQMFPMYADVAKYPDAMLEGFWSEAQCFITPSKCRCHKGHDCWERIMYYMVAHLLWLNDLLMSGSGSGGLVTAATVDKVSVTLAAPPFGTSEWKYWLFKSPFGEKIAAMFKKMSAGGMYVGGRDERGSFRKSGGRFY